MLSWCMDWPRSDKEEPTMKERIWMIVIKNKGQEDNLPAAHKSP
jgi:hypothetical protein